MQEESAHVSEKSGPRAAKGEVCTPCRGPQLGALASTTPAPPWRRREAKPSHSDVRAAGVTRRAGVEGCQAAPFLLLHPDTLARRA